MKAILKNGVVRSIALLTAGLTIISCSPKQSLTFPQANEPLFLKTNFHCLRLIDRGGKEIFHANVLNMLDTGSSHCLIPVNTPVKIREGGRGIIFEDFAEGREIIFNYRGKKIAININAYIDSIVSPVQISFDDFSEIDRKGIKDGKAYLGMTKDGVRIALGCPPPHKTPSLDLNTWTYWYDGNREVSVEFDGSGHVEKAPADPRETFSKDFLEIKPEPGKALVWFVRPAIRGFTKRAAVFDGDKAVGNIPSRQKVAYMADPGDHLFMVVSARDLHTGEKADFLKAFLEAGKIYFVFVVEKKPGFSLKPHEKRELSTKQFLKRFKRCVLRDLDGNVDHARNWSAQNQDEIQAARTAGLDVWNKIIDWQRPFLQLEDGI